MSGGGGGGKMPTTPDNNGKSGTDFPASWDIFGWDPEKDGGPPNNPLLVANEVDIAPLVWGNEVTEGNYFIPGDVVCVPDSSGSSFAAVVSQVAQIGQNPVIELKFFSNTLVDSNRTVVMYVPGGAYLEGTQFNYPDQAHRGWIVSDPIYDNPQNPRVVLRTVGTYSGQHSWPWFIQFEVDVAYEESNSHGIKVYHNNFWMMINQGDPLVSFLYNVNPSFATVSNSDDLLFPDLEFCPTDADLHLVYDDFDPTVQEGPQATIMHCQRSDYGSFGSALSVSGNDVNAWVPRIDVGTVTDPFGFQLTGNVMTVAVVYTRQDLTQGQAFSGFRPWVHYWYEAEDPWSGNNHNTVAIVNSDWQPDHEPPNPCEYYGSGMPVIDIAPESNTYHDAYVAFTQQVTGLPIPITYAVYVVGDPLSYGQNDNPFLALTAIDGSENAVLPAICAHQGPREMSVTYYDDTSGPSVPWGVTANRVDYVDDRLVGYATPVQNVQAHGSFNIDDLQHFNYGIASGIAQAITYGEDSYFAAWSDSVGSACEPCHIKLTFGYTTHW